MPILRMNSQYLFPVVLTCLLLAGCSLQDPLNSLDPDAEIQEDLKTDSVMSITESIVNTPQNNPEPGQCLRTYAARELREPYQRYEEDEPRFTLSEEDLLKYFDLMGIESICPPVQFGSPFINVDWGEHDSPATGRMVSIGFEELYEGGGWSHGYLLYSTYDFSIGSEYEVFASAADFDRLQEGSNPDLLHNADGVNGFVRFHPGIPMGKQMILKTYIFPFDTYYVAAVINVGAYDSVDVDNILVEMEAGQHPDLMNENITLMDILVSSIIFR